MNNLEPISPRPTPAYIVTPAKQVTGGPEFCHQICAELNKYPDIDAKILYLTEKSNPQPLVYTLRYNNPYTVNHKPEKDSILFIPEILSESFDVSFLFDCKVIFFVWMSVNYYLSTVSYSKLNFFPSKVIHLAQTEYSKDYLLNFAKVKKEKILPLVDYVSDDFLLSVPNDPSEKENIIVFQNSKASEFLKNVLLELQDRGRSKNTKLVGIKNMTTREIVEVFKKSKVFLNLGWNPGMDRMNREAVILDNCIISSTQGSGFYWEDVRVEDKYKFYPIEENVKECADRVEECLDRYEERIEDFKEYKEMVRGQKREFEKNIENIVKWIREKG